MPLLWELLLQSLREINAYKLRSLLALLGIFWGTVIIALLLALGKGFYTAGQYNMASLSNGSLRAWPGFRSQAHKGLPPGQAIQIKADEIMQLAKIIPEVYLVSPILSVRLTLQGLNKQVSTSVLGVSPDAGIANQILPTPSSRFISDSDISQNRRVIFLGSKLKQQLFGDIDPIGKYLTIKGIPFLIIGLQKAQEKDSSYLNWNENNAIIPYTTFISIWGNVNINRFILIPRASVKSSVFEAKILDYLSQKYLFKPIDKSAVIIFNTGDIKLVIDWFFSKVELFLGFCGFITLCVGGIGLANLMFLTISERTQEIGLRMALGAHRAHLMIQIMMETALLVFTGGLIGFIIAELTIKGINHLSLPDWLGQPALSPLLIFIIVSILSILSLLAGYFPARYAAHLQPVEALSFA